MRHRAFTLVELLVVCVILGVVVVIAVPRFMNSYASSKLKVFNVNMQEIRTALENYRTENGTNTGSFYPLKLEDLQDILVKTPNNPYTNKNMLTSIISDAGIFYKPVGVGADYTLICTQNDADDIDHDKNTKEVIPCEETINHNLITDNWMTSGITLSGTDMVTAVALSSPNSAKQILHKQVQGTVLLFHIRADSNTHIMVTLNDRVLEVPVNTEWQKYAVVYDRSVDTVQIQFSEFPINKNVYIKDIVLVDK